MEIHVYDTYVKARDQHTMHFDVFMAEKDDQKAVEYAKQWLNSIDETEAVVSSKECRFCHSQKAPTAVIDSIREQGYYIYQMEGCPEPSA
jgi:nitrate/TMAO reductase-like tetraheme cytochrome c subunit